MARMLLDPTKTFPVREVDLDLGDAFEADAEVTYHLRPLTIDKARTITKAHTGEKFNVKTRRAEPVVDDETLQDALVDYCLVNWEGIVDGDVPVPCTLGNKLKLPGPIQSAIIRRASAGTVSVQAPTGLRVIAPSEAPE
jgi:hypothetical protein